ncbi:MAG: alpha/beta hydrolase family protein, partial [Actinomycetota bacterium]
MKRLPSVRFGAAGVALAAGLSISLPAGATLRQEAPGRGRSIRCSDTRDAARRTSIEVDGERATGHYALPAGRPRGLVVFAHGYGHSSYSWIEHMKNATREHNVIAVAMDYRGLRIQPDSNNDGLPESRGWPVMTGAEDSIAAAQLFQALCPSIRKTVLLGVSMGGNASGLAVALAKDAKQRNGGPLWDYWVDVEGVANVIETYTGARALAPGNAFAGQAQQDIEAEMGGTLEESPQAYAERCVVCRINDIKESGVKGVVVIHGFDDGLVPYNQAREMGSALLGAGIPTDMFSVGRKDASDRDTTVTGAVVGPVDENYNSP